VFLSSASDDMNIVMAMNMGGDDFIAKPVDPNVMNAKLQAILRRAYDMPSPLLTRLLKVLFLAEKSLFLFCTLGALGAFAIIYVLIYRVTARVYYQIVR
jgi:hypothetical protein